MARMRIVTPVLSALALAGLSVSAIAERETSRPASDHAEAQVPLDESFIIDLSSPAEVEAAAVEARGGRSTGPDVIVGDLFKEATEPFGVRRWGRRTDLGPPITAYSVGTISCNVGTEPVRWQVDTTEHPVIGSHLYRLKTVNGSARFEQIGMGWLKHAFFALSENLCYADCQPTDGTILGVHCSDPYTSQLNGQQTNLGPRNEVNAATGLFAYPWNAPNFPTTIGRRLQVFESDIHPPSNAGAQYFIEGEYVTDDDARAGNNKNNSSYRPLQVVWSGGTSTVYNLDWIPGQETRREHPALHAWRDVDPTVQISNVDICGDGRLTLASKATDLGGGQWHYEYALYNMNSDRSVGTFTVPLPPGTTVTNIGFHDVFYHSNGTNNTSYYDGTDWPGTASSCSVSWACTPYGTNQNANALRWGTTYNFRFDANQPPGNVRISLGLFKPANGDLPTRTVMSAQGPVAASVLVDCNSNGREDSLDLSCGLSSDCDLNGVPDECQFSCDCDEIPDVCELAGGAPDCNGNALPDSCELAGNDCNQNGILDSCQLAGNDCNNNGTPDICDIAGGAPDCNGNGRPDSCDSPGGTPDCNGNGQLDACDIASGTSSDCVLAPAVLFADNFPVAAIDPTRWAEVVGATTATNPIRSSPRSLNLDATDRIRSVTIPLSPWSDAVLSYYYRNISTETSDNLLVEYWNGSYWQNVTTHFGTITNSGVWIAASVPLPPAAHRPDFAFRFVAAGDTVADDWYIDDLQLTTSGRNGIPDDCEPNCDGVGPTDACELGAGATDCNGNGVPDSCELAANDCDSNGAVDSCDIAGGAPDCNNNGLPDSCDLPGNDCNSNSTPDSCDVASGAPDCNGNGRPDACDLAGADCNNNGTPDSCELAGNDCNANGSPDECDLAGNDCSGNGIPDNCEPNCDGIGGTDACEIAGGASDCNSNGIPDGCELPGNDCNGNGTVDSCDIAGGAQDCNTNGQPDDCELQNNDCNSNGTLDLCDVAGGAPDCNGNGRPDSCDLAENDCNTNSIPDSCELPANDCQPNGTLDSCDIAGGFSEDANGDGTPDECLPPAPPAVLVTAVSRKGCDLALEPGVKTEPRSGGVTQVRIAFDQPPADPPGSQSGVTIDQRTCAAPTFVPYSGAASASGAVTGNELVISFAPALENAVTYRINIGPVVSSVGGQSVQVRGLKGDVDGSGYVDGTDRSTVVGIWTGSGFSCATDVSNDGVTNGLDRSEVVAAWTGGETCAP